MGETTFTFRVDQELRDAFTAVAKEQDRTGAQLLRDFMRDYVRRGRAGAQVENWLRQEAIPAAEAMRQDPSRGRSPEQVRATLDQAHAKETAKRKRSG